MAMRRALRYSVPTSTSYLRYGFNAVPMHARSYSKAAPKVDPVALAIKDTFDRFAKDGDFDNAYEELVLRGFSDTDAVNAVIDLAVKKNDETTATKLVDKMKSDNIAFNKRTVLVLRHLAQKLIPEKKAEIEAEEAKELAALDAALKA